MKYRVVYFDPSDRCIYFEEFSKFYEVKIFLDELSFRCSPFPSDLYFAVEGVENDEEV